MTNETGLATIPARNQLATADTFMPTLTIEQAVERYSMMAQFVEKVLRDGIDFGTIPGASKPGLLKPGAEKLSTIFGLSPEFIYDVAIEDWLGKQFGEPLFSYRLRCRLTKNGVLIGEGVGAASSWESKYRYRWVNEDEIPPGIDPTTLRSRDGRKTLLEFMFSLDKRETTGKYGKPLEYWEMWDEAIKTGKARRIEKETRNGKVFPAWEFTVGERQYRIPNPDIADVVNTVLKMAKKRAHIDAVLNGTNASDFFSQDEDFGEQLAAESNELKAKREEKEQAPSNGNQGEEISDELNSYYDRMPDMPAFLGLCGELKWSLHELTGNDDAYYGVLKGTHKIEKAATMRGLEMKRMKEIVRDLVDALNEAAKAKREAPQEESANAKN